MLDLGCAAVMAAGAQEDAGVDHPPGKEKRRASSEKPRKITSRSRSPGGGSRGVRAAAAGRVSSAPVYV